MRKLSTFILVVLSFTALAQDAPVTLVEKTKPVRLLVTLGAGAQTNYTNHRMVQLESSLHLVFKNDVTLGLGFSRGFNGRLIYTKNVFSYRNISLLLGKNIQIAKNISLHFGGGIGFYKSVVSTNAIDSLLTFGTGLLGSKETRYIQTDNNLLGVPIFANFYLNKRKFMGLYLGLNSFIGKETFYVGSTIGFAFGQRKSNSVFKKSDKKPLPKVGQDFNVGIYSGVAGSGRIAKFSIASGLDVSYQIVRNVKIGIGYELLNRLSLVQQQLINNPNSFISGNNLNFKIGFVHAINDNFDFNFSVGYARQNLRSTSYSIDQELLQKRTVENFFNGKTIVTPFKIEKSTTNGILIEPNFIRVAKGKTIGFYFGPKFVISSEPIYSFKIGLLIGNKK